jgi:hypothetical protein
MAIPQQPPFDWYVRNAAEGPRRRKAWAKKYGQDDYPTWNPHCDDKVLHSPLAGCKVCDLFPEAQMLRVQWGINFTGEHLPGFMTCPAELQRDLRKIERWGGNRVSAGSDDGWFTPLRAPTAEEIEATIESLKRMAKELKGQG